MANKTGRPPKFSLKTAERVLFLSAKGLTEEELCQVLDISTVTLWKWKTSPTFLKALKESKGSIDEQVKRSLLSRALGYDYNEEHYSEKAHTAITVTKKMHPDVTACIFWLKNRQPKDWREKREDEGANNKPAVIRLFSKLNSDEITAVRSGENQTDILLGKDFVDGVKHNGASSNGAH